MTDSHYYKRKTCRLCDGSRLALALHLTPTPPADSYVPMAKGKIKQSAYPLDLYLCHDCGFAQLLDIVRPESVYIDYTYETTSSLGLVEHFQKYADEVIAKLKAQPGGLVVDIGSNDGTLLSAFKKRGMKVLGVDPAREIARRATERGIETLADFFTEKKSHEISGRYGKAAIITTNNLYANVDELHDYTEGVRHLLAPEGTFIFESFYLVDLIKNMVFDFIYHEHLSAFSVKPLIKFFDRHGMELFDVQSIPTKGGSLRYYVQLKGGPHQVSERVSGFARMESEFGSDKFERFKDFTARIEHAKNAALKFIEKACAEGKSVAGYGASATTTTLLYHFGLTDKIDFIVDDFAAKHDTYSPGCHIPVYPSSALGEKKPDYVFVFAWRYFEPIMKKHKAFSEAGGKFIVPLPELKVL